MNSRSRCRHHRLERIHRAAAQFLVLVARHSGVCVMRQYSAFAGVVFGHTTRRFFTELERLGWVSTYDCARKRARIYHVRHRELYEAIGDAESASGVRPPCHARLNASCCSTSS